jgi:hypothetical protein
MKHWNMNEVLNSCKVHNKKKKDLLDNNSKAKMYEI